MKTSKYLKKIFAFIAVNIEGTVTPNDDHDTINDLISSALVEYIIPAAAALAVGFVIYSGVLYIMSSGEPEKTAKAKKSLLWSIAGTILIVLSILIVEMVSRVLKSEILVPIP